MVLVSQPGQSAGLDSRDLVRYQAPAVKPVDISCVHICSAPEFGGDSLANYSHPAEGRIKPQMQHMAISLEKHERFAATRMFDMKFFPVCGAVTPLLVSLCQPLTLFVGTGMLSDAHPRRLRD